MPETFHSPQQVKVFILYLLEKVGYPLDYNDLATIIIRDGYVDYFDFVTYFLGRYALPAERVKFCVYDTGHAAYVGGDAAKEVCDDMRSFIAGRK